MAASFWSIGEAQKAGPTSEGPEAIGYGVGLLTWFLGASVFIAVSATAGEMPPWTMVFWRVFLATLILLPIVHGSFGDMGRFIRHRGLEAFVVGAIGLGLTQGLVFTALNYTTAVAVGIIFATTPIVTLILAGLVLREPLGPWQILGSLVAFGGIVVISVKGSWATLLGFDIGTGDLIVVAAAITFACYTVLLKRAKFELPRLPLLAVLMGGGAIAALPFFLYELYTGQHDNLALKGYLALAYTVTFGGAFMYLCYNWSIEILGAARAGVLLYSQMVFTAVLAWLILGETIAWYHYAGAALIVVGVILVTFLKPKTKAMAA